MPFPFGVGSGLGGGPSLMGLRRLLKRLLPSGYAETRPLLDEIECWAAMLYDGHTLPQRIANESFVALTSELLDEWEREYGLPNDAARTPAERQDRLVAAERAIGGAIRTRVEDALRAISADANWLTTTQADIFYDDLTTWPSLIYQHVVQLSASEWASPAVRRASARVVQRMSAARSHFQHGYTDPNEAIVVKVDAEWGSADHVVGRDAIGREVAVTLDRYEQVATLRRYGPLSKIRAADLNAVQDNTLFQRVTDGVELDAVPGCAAGRIAIAFAVEVPAGTTVLCDAAASWLERLVTVWTSTASDDIRPGEVNDEFVGTSTLAQKLWYTGAGATDVGAAASAFSALLDTDVYLYADDTNGRLKIRNETGGTRYVVAMLHATGVVANISGNARHVYTFVDGTTFAAAGFTASFFQAWSRAGTTRTGETSGPALDIDAWPDFAGAGGSFVVAVVPAVLPDETKVIDAYRDWRDRILAVTCVSIQLDTFGVGETDPAWPGSSRFDQLQRHPAQATVSSEEPHTILTYTREGDASGASTTGTMVELETYARVWVDESTGILKLTRDSGDTDTSPECYLLLIHATEQLGVYSTPTALEVLGVVDGDPVHPQDLNQAQERALCVQAVGYPEAALTTTASIPLGPISGPATPTIPETWASEHPSRPFSQQIAGWARVFFSGIVPANSGELVLDTTRDWRDRFAWAQIAYSATTDRTLGGADPGGINAASDTTRESSARYLGDGAATLWADAGDNPYAVAEDGTGYELRLVSAIDTDAVLLYARASDGALCIASNRASDLAVTAMVEATFQFGLRKT